MPFSRTLERTLALIKPDAVKALRVREIMQLTELAGFTIIDHRKLWVSLNQVLALMHVNKALGTVQGKGSTGDPTTTLVTFRAEALRSTAAVALRFLF
jgi:nucleoside diphosphate kinase